MNDLENYSGDLSYIIFDNDCGLCNQSVGIIVRQDKNKHYQYLPNNSKVARRLLSEYGLEGLEKETVILIEKDGSYYIKAQAVRKILSNLPYLRILGIILYTFPLFILNPIYDFIAKHRNMLTMNSGCET